MAPATLSEENEPLGVADLERSHWTELARKHWPKAVKSKKVQSVVIKTELWNALEMENYHVRSLLILESLRLLENYLWPGYTEDSTHHHVLLIALMSTVKSREKLPVWDVYSNDSQRFASLFRRVLSMCLDTSLSNVIRTHLLSFLICAFQSLDNGLLRKECAPLVSISIWQHLESDIARERRFEQNPQFRKAWRASAKRHTAADGESQAKLHFERAWLFSMITDFMSRLHERSGDDVIYCERFLEFLTDLESQLPTRRYVNTLIHDLNLLAVIRISPMFNHAANGLLRDLFVLFRHFVNFPIDDNTGAQHSRVQSHEKHSEDLAKLQRTALKSFKSKLTILALANYSSIDQRKELETHLQPLTESELADLCTLLGFRTTYPPVAKVKGDRELLLEVLLSFHERRKTFPETISSLSILPTETTLYEPTLLRNETYDGSQPLAIPKLNLQYLTVGDFLWRAFILYRCESFFEIKTDMEDVLQQLQPRTTDSGVGAHAAGYSKMAIPISKPAITEVAPPRVGTEEPNYVKAEIIFNDNSLADSVRREWESLRQGDVVYLLAVHPTDDRRSMTNGSAHLTKPAHPSLRTLRTAEIVQLLDDRGRSLREVPLDETNGHGGRQRLRRMIVNLDPAEYKLDCDRKAAGKPDAYESINFVVRRKGRENNFSRILKTIQGLALSDVPIPAWLHDIFLGFGDPASATYTRLTNRLRAVDFRDTFLNWEHLIQSFPGKSVKPAGEQHSSLGPPYVLETHVPAPVEEPRPSKKRQRDDEEPQQQSEESKSSKKRRRADAGPQEGAEELKSSNKRQPGDEDPQKPRESIIQVSTYQPPNSGPYPSDVPKLNTIPFTPAQVEAIVSGTQPGLTIIVGPPGTGKTDVAAQIVNNIYHDFPEQRTVLIAHSNQALNQLFQKIIKLDIDERHLLRLGHGEEDLETDANYGKYGRVESFLNNRARFLAEVDRLAANFGAPGAHGNSCETAGYFESVYVRPAWSKFWDTADAAESASEIASAFPFNDYFRDAPQPIFPFQASREQVIDIAIGCQRHIYKIFSELEDIRPFEILRTVRDKTNYLMIKEARIIAMTSTHAAMRRQEIADLGFHYENVVMEEAAQITEIENFIPMALQQPKEGELPLQRIVLCGDHLQNSPIVQNRAFRQFANLEQSLFLRLVRLGVPTIELDRQGRARSSIAQLYKWRYRCLDDLPNVKTESEYLAVNAGFRHEYQFIDVPDYKGQGEVQPSPHFIHNLGEAEYAVAIYQYMRLLGYPATKITILTTYAGQRALIRDVLSHRCARNRIFGMPRLVTTVDKYQGEQNDYIILSLTRTTRVGYLRDIRRLTVALSRARLGLYILGRRTVFESCHELREAFSRLLSGRPDKLMVVTGEIYGGVARLVGDKVESTEMTGVEHMGQYVYEMTKAKIEASSTQGQALAESRPLNADIADAVGDSEGEYGKEEVEEQQPEALDLLG